MPIRLVLAEDKPRLARALAADLALFDDLYLVATFSHGRALLAGIDRLAPPPALVLMDVEMPQLDGIAATAQLRERYPDLPILMLTVFEDEERLFAAVQAGADGYLLKGLSPEALHRAIHEAVAGGAPMSPLIARTALRLLRTGRPRPVVGAALSEREIEVLRLLAAGLPYKAIAAELFLSQGTIRKHIEHIYRKLRVNNKVSAVSKGRDLGLLED